MRAHVLKYWGLLRSSFWFVPSLMAAAAIALAFALTAVDEMIAGANGPVLGGWAYTGGPEGAGRVLSTIAGSMITIAGVVFSMTLVALSLASSQLGPRLLRNFMRDTTNQVVLGTFIATFVYCLLVLRTIRWADEDAFVPHLSVTTGVLFALASLGVLIYFIHHVAVAVQADDAVARIGNELLAALEHVFPEGVGQARPADAPGAFEHDIPAAFERDAHPVRARRDGYVQVVDADALMELASECDLLLRVERRPGAYVVRGAPLARMWPREQLSDEVAARARSAFALGEERTHGQDVGFIVRQLVEIAVRALSPGINDPFTALACVDRLGSALCRLAQREMPSPYRFDPHGRLRVVAPAVTFPEVLDAAFSPIRQYSRASTVVAIRLLDTIAVIAAVVDRADDRAALARHAEMIARAAREAIPEEDDRGDVQTSYQAARVAIAGAASAARQDAAART